MGLFVFSDEGGGAKSLKDLGHQAVKRFILKPPFISIPAEGLSDSLSKGCFGSKAQLLFNSRRGTKPIALFSVAPFISGKQGGLASEFRLELVGRSSPINKAGWYANRQKPFAFFAVCHGVSNGLPQTSPGVALTIVYKIHAS